MPPVSSEPGEGMRARDANLVLAWSSSSTLESMKASTGAEDLTKNGNVNTHLVFPSINNALKKTPYPHPYPRKTSSQLPAPQIDYDGVDGRTATLIISL